MPGTPSLRYNLLNTSISPKPTIEIKGLKLKTDEYCACNIDEFSDKSEEDKLNHKIKKVSVFWLKECVVGL